MFRPRYLKPGPGVPKEEAPMHPVLKFFKLTTRKFWDLSKVNILYILSAIPFLVILFFAMGFLSAAIVNSISGIIAEAYGYATDSQELTTVLVWYDIAIRFILAFEFIIFFGSGPISAGITNILKNYTKETHVFMISDFKNWIKTEMKQSICVFIIDILVVIGLSFAALTYSALGGNAAYIIYFIILIFEIYAIMHLYIYTLMVTFELPVKGILKNSLIFTFAKLPKNLLLMLITATVHIILPCAIFFVFKSLGVLMAFAFLEFAVLPVLTGYMNIFFTYPAIDDMVKMAEENNG